MYFFIQSSSLFITNLKKKTCFLAEFFQMNSTTATTTTTTQPPEPIKISTIQSQNPLIKEYFKPSEYKIINTHKSIHYTDYEISSKISILFLCLNYHKKHPGYLLNRIKNLTKVYENQILLVLPNMENSTDTEKHLFAVTEICISNRIQLVLAFTYKHAAKIIKEMTVTRSPSILSTAMKSASQKRAITEMNNNPSDNFDINVNELYADDLKGSGSSSLKNSRNKRSTQDRLTDATEVCFQYSRIGVNSTDVKNLILNCKNVVGISKLPASEIQNVRGIGQKKATRIAALFDQPFVSI